MLRDRVVFLGGLADGDVATLISQLITLERADAEAELTIYVNCDGGTAESTLAVYDTMQFLRCPVATLCVGQARGGASMILATGTPGRRAALPNAHMLVRQPPLSFDARGADPATVAGEAERVRATVVEIYARHCGRPVEEVERDTDRGLILRPADAVAWGLVDRVVERPPKPWAGILSSG